MSRPFGALQVAHQFIESHVRPGAFCIDATAGRGNDTVFLASLVGETGKVLAFDIQPEAVESTRALIGERGCSGFTRVVLDSHANMARYAAPGSVDCIVFNFGWLPGGDHSVNTRAESSIAAIEAGLTLLNPRGVMSLIFYYGRDTGYAERDALLAYLRTIDHRAFTVVVADFCNRPNDPPLPVFLIKDA